MKKNKLLSNISIKMNTWKVFGQDSNKAFKGFNDNKMNDNSVTFNEDIAGFVATISTYNVAQTNYGSITSRLNEGYTITNLALPERLELDILFSDNFDSPVVVQSSTILHFYKNGKTIVNFVYKFQDERSIIANNYRYNFQKSLINFNKKLNTKNCSSLCF